MFNRNNPFGNNQNRMSGTMEQQFQQFRKDHPCQDPYAEIEKLVSDGKIPRQLADFALSCARGDPLRKN